MSPYGTSDEKSSSSIGSAPSFTDPSPSHFPPLNCCPAITADEEESDGGAVGCVLGCEVETSVPVAAGVGGVLESLPEHETAATKSSAANSKGSRRNTGPTAPLYSSEPCPKSGGMGDAMGRCLLGKQMLYHWATLALSTRPGGWRPPEAEGLRPGYRDGCERWQGEAAAAGKG